MKIVSSYYLLHVLLLFLLPYRVGYIPLLNFVFSQTLRSQPPCFLVFNSGLSFVRRKKHAGGHFFGPIRFCLELVRRGVARGFSEEPATFA